MAQELLQPLPASRVEHMTEAAKTFAASLDDEGREYLEGRGLAEVAAAAGLGRVPGDSGPEWERYVGMLSIPYLTVDREVVSIRFRTIDPEDSRPKYLQPPGSETSIYNMPALARNHKTVIVTEGECLPGGAEVLTPGGWTRFDELDPEAEVAQWDGGELRFVKPLAHIRKPYSGEMVRYQNSQRFVSVTTPGHGMPGVTATGAVKKYAAESDVPYSRSIPRGGVLDGPGTGLSRDELALMLAISADAAIREPKGGGRREPRGRFYYVFGFRKERKVERLEGILERLGIKFGSEPIAGGYRSICFSSTPGVEWMQRELPHHLLSSMSADEREFCLAEMAEWDGNRVAGRNQTEYSSKLRSNAEWMQTLAHTAGRVSTVMERSNSHGTWFKTSVLHGKSTTSWQGLDKARVMEEFDGEVFCVQVPSGYFLVRQEGCISVTGNCDALTLEALGYTAIGMPGANSWKPHYSRALDGFQRVIVAGDPDEAGQKFNETIMSSIRRATAMHMKADINDTANQPGGFLEIAEAFAKAGGSKD